MSRESDQRNERDESQRVEHARAQAVQAQASRRSFLAAGGAAIGLGSFSQ